MLDPVRHVVIDANIIASYFHPGSVKNPILRARCKALLDSAIKAQWPGIRLFSPAICVAEAMSVLDKYRFCTWHGPLRSDPTARLSAKRYKRSRDALAAAVRARIIERLPHEHEHVLLSGLVSPINNGHQIRRKTRGATKGNARIKPPMGAADCLIAGLTIHLVSRLGPKSVLLATADQRMADVINRAHRLNHSTAEKLGLLEVAEQAGIEWSPTLYPKCINLNRDSDRELQEAFGGWPLPEKPCTEKKRSDLLDSEKESLIKIWLDVGKQQEITNPDRLPYSMALEQIRVSFADKTQVYMTSDEVFWFLMNRRKAGELPKPEF